jgi:putative metalloprotease
MKIMNKILLTFVVLFYASSSLFADDDKKESKSYWDTFTDILPTEKIEEVLYDISEKIDIDEKEKKVVEAIEDALPDSIITKSMTSAVKSASDITRATLISDKEMHEEDAKDITKWDINQTVAKDIDQYYIDLQKIMKRIPLPKDLDVKLDVKVYLNPFLYIISKSNGAIRVNSGIIELLEDDEILFLMAHEIAHIASKDHKGSYRKAHSMYALENALNMQGETAGSVANGLLESVTSRMRKSEFQKDEEFEADKYAIGVLKKLGIKKQVAIDTLEELQYLNAPLLKIHPTGHERVKNIKDNL